MVPPVVAQDMMNPVEALPIESKGSLQGHTVTIQPVEDIVIPVIAACVFAGAAAFAFVAVALPAVGAAFVIATATIVTTAVIRILQKVREENRQIQAERLRQQEREREILRLQAIEAEEKFQQLRTEFGSEFQQLQGGSMTEACDEIKALVDSNQRLEMPYREEASRVIDALNFKTFQKNVAQYVPELESLEEVPDQIDPETVLWHQDQHERVRQALIDSMATETWTYQKVQPVQDSVMDLVDLPSFQMSEDRLESWQALRDVTARLEHFRTLATELETTVTRGFAL